MIKKRRCTVSNAYKARIGRRNETSVDAAQEEIAGSI
jgi:hypothetical protein